jgi:hypothetical protein
MTREGLPPRQARKLCTLRGTVTDRLQILQDIQAFAG